MAEKGTIITVKDRLTVNPVIDAVARGLMLTQPSEEVRDEMLKQVNIYDLSKGSLTWPFKHLTYLAFLGPTPLSVSTSMFRPKRYPISISQINADLATNNEYYKSNQIFKPTKLHIEPSLFLPDFFISQSSKSKLGNTDTMISFTDDKNSGILVPILPYYAEARVLQNFNSNSYVRPSESILVVTDHGLSEDLKRTNPNYHSPSHFVLTTKLEELPNNLHIR